MIRINKTKVWTGVLVIILVIIVVVLLTPMFHQWNAQRVNDIRQPYITQNAHVRVQTYEWFYAMDAEIKATRNKAKLAVGGPEEKGIRMVLESMIAEYNAKSRMTTTKAQWKAHDLPYQIETD